MSRCRVGVLSVAPSPYQRDLFGALAARAEVELKVFYQERRPDDSPWPERPLASYEEILPAKIFRFGSVRSHWNTGLPDPSDFDLWIVNGSLTSVTVQQMMRWNLEPCRWLFWGERLRKRHGWTGQNLQRILASPLRQSAGIVSIGSMALEDYRRRFPHLLHAMIPYCTELESFCRAASERPAADGDITFLFCGQMIRRKGIDLLLQSFDALVREGAPIRLLLVGREAELPRLLPGLCAAARQRLVYEGFQPPEDLPQFFARAHVFILPSRHDGWGVVVNQALGAGLPVLCTDQVGAAKDLIENGVNGLVFPAGDGAALTSALRTAWKKRAELAKWGEKSAQKAEEITPSAGAQRWVEILQMARTRLMEEGQDD